MDTALQRIQNLNIPSKEMFPVTRELTELLKQAIPRHAKLPVEGVRN